MALTPIKTPIKYIRLLHYSVDVKTQYIGKQPKNTIKVGKI